MQFQAGRPGAGASRLELDTAPQAQLLDVQAQVCDVQVIERAHQRSSSYGITRGQRPDLSTLSNADLALVLESSQALSGHARPVMETLYDQIRDTHSMVILSDAQGTILHTLGDRDFLTKADRVALGAGGLWSEQLRGTNAIGTALFEQRPTTVHARQHYLEANRFLTCSAAPIFDPRGQVLGVLDVSGESGSFHKHTMALVRMSAQMIENQLLAGSFSDCLTLHFHSRPEFVGTLVEGIASFSPCGRFLAANRSAQFQLGLSLAALQSHTFSSLFGASVSQLLDQHRQAAAHTIALSLHNGIRIHARAEMRLQDLHFQHARDAAVVTPPAMTPPPASARASDGLQALATGDPRLQALLDKLQRVIGRDIPILLTGETGTGKEWLAQAIHRQTHGREDAPFVAVNCSAIPENLIEAELFGYEDGAFTGARRKGASGKLVQAHGGTLFLDEIGDMPLALQGRLLRVLQERAVTPLGASRAVPVAFTLVCATHQPLRQMVAARQFREDLYYRINGLLLKLPPLREREDLAQLVHNIIARHHQATGPAPTPDAAVWQLLRACAWPGNLRQLSNLLRIALVMADGEPQIGPQHLPEDFLEELTGDDNPSASASAVPAPASAVAASITAPLHSLQESEWVAIDGAIRAHRGNVSAAAKALGISRNTIYRRIKARTPARAAG